MTATLLDFARVNDAAAATRKKLEKQAIFSTYLRRLSEADLRLAVRFAAGRPFAATDERVLNVGGALVWDAVVSLLSLDPVKFHDTVVRNGEIGEALSAIWPDRPPPAPRLGITLLDVSEAFDDLSSTGVQARKREMLNDLFDHCTHPREAAYLAKIIFRDMRTGVQEASGAAPCNVSSRRVGRAALRCCSTVAWAWLHLPRKLRPPLLRRASAATKGSCSRTRPRRTHPADAGRFG